MVRTAKGPSTRAGRAAHISEGHPSSWLSCVVALLLVFSFCSTGCMDIQMRVGTRPNTDLLESSLRIGESTQADVQRILGKSEGTGVSMLPIEPKPRTVWAYYYEEGSMKDDRRIFLFVYFDQDRYDGYMWFSSLPK